MPVLDELPVELIYHIFDYLDPEIILLSVQYVCKHLYTIVKSYNRYEFNFKSIRKQIFHQISRSINPANVISLVLSDDFQTCGQVRLFLLCYTIDKYVRLHSVTLLSIGEQYLTMILKHLSTSCCLKSLTIHCESSLRSNSEVLALLSLVIGQTSLHKLDLHLNNDIIDDLNWPTQCSIKYLKLFHSIKFENLYTILQNSPYLKTMIVRDCIMNDIQGIAIKTTKVQSFRQLTSFTLEDCDLEMEMIEYLLSIMPSLINFTLIGNNKDLFDGARWEHFIQVKLPDLNNFEFALQSEIDIVHNINGLNNLIKSFQTTFWLETKRWFVTALCIETSNLINLYTNRDCATKINFHPNSKKLVRSTAANDVNNVIVMENVRELTLDLIDMEADMKATSEGSIFNKRLFNNLTKLTLRLDSEWPDGSLEFLSEFIDLKTISDLVLDINFNVKNGLDTIAMVKKLFKKALNIRSLSFANQTCSVENIFELIPTSVPHLLVPVRDIEEMKLIITRLKHLSSITFAFPLDNSISKTEVIEWLQIQRDFTYEITTYSFSIWLGQHRNILL